LAHRKEARADDNRANCLNMRDRNDEFIPTRRSLLSRLKDWDDRESWRDFFDTYGKLIYGLARKAGLSDAEAQDAVQDTLIAAAKEMPGFKYNPAIGSFKGWLLEVARRRIANQFRKRSPGKSARGADRPPASQAFAHLPSGRREPDEARTATIERISDPNSEDLDRLWEEEWQKNSLEVALARVKRRCNAKQYQIFNLYVTQQWPIELVKSTLSVSAAQVYMAKMRISRLIKSEVRTLERKMI
jgi:RNA polymerase sigma factor (sigma-70 family)